MSLEDLKSKVKIAQEVVKDIDPKLKEKAFEVILNKLLEGSDAKAPAKISIPSKEFTPEARRSSPDFYKQKSPSSNAAGWKMSYPRQEDKTMYPAVCADCGKETTVPFKPTQRRPVYCRDCFQKHRGPSF